ncbi:MAG: hypothetical protein A2Z27_04765 [candidate division Zixibacteria bacterium RBG_16_50_21]|nr:MAG: hypothetical protein A2Z27_04765 [candidate division Zixibacteria bacterium RBG_16_50_21]
MISLSVKESLGIVKGSLIEEKPEFLDTHFTGVSIDSRTVSKGNLFVALSGEKYDGHDFVAQAVKSGARAVLVAETKRQKISSGVTGTVPVISVKDSKLALQSLGANYRQRFDIPVVAITGSNGKTTTKEMTAQVLASRYEVVKSQKSFNTQVGVPLTIFELTPETEVLILELGTSQFGELSRLTEIARPTSAVILNIGPAHLETFGSLENVAKAKFELLDRLPEDKPAFLNLDDPFLRKRASQERHKVVSFALQTKADYQALDLLISGNGHIDFKVRHNLVRLNILGRHNVYNALATYAVAESFGLSHQEIARELENYKPALLRMEILETGGVKLINDSYNANPVSMLAALESLMQTKTAGRRIAVLGDMLELGNEAKKLHQEIGKKAAESDLDYLLTVGVLAEFIARSAEVNGFSKKRVKSFDNNQAATEHLLEILKPGDTVLLKGSRRMKLEEIAERLQLDMRSRG